MTPISTPFDTLTARIESCNRILGVTLEVITLKGKISVMKKDVDYLKSTNFTPLLEALDDQDAPQCLEMPSSTTKDVPKDDVAADELEADEVQLDAQEATIYGDVPNLVQAIIQSIIQTSLTEMSKERSDRATVVANPSINPLDLSVTVIIDALTDGTTMQILYFFTSLFHFY